MKKTLPVFTVLLLSVLAPHAHADVLFYDGFDGTSNDVDRSQWTSPTGDAATFGRTTIRDPGSSPNDGLPTTVEVVNGIAELRLDTFNPTAQPSNMNFWGSEIDTIQKWQPQNGGGIQFEASVKLDSSLPPGLNTSVFAFGLTGNGTNKDEIDFEFPSKQPGEVLTNHFKDEPASSAGTLQQWFPAGLKENAYNVFQMDWYPNKIDWYVNNTLVTSTTDNIPTHPMGLDLNIWAPDSNFPAAYDPSLQPADSLAEDQAYFYDVDWVKVSTIPVPEPASWALLLAAGIPAVLWRRFFCFKH